MCWLLDGCYLIIVTLASPWLLYRAIRTNRYHRGLSEKFLGIGPGITTSFSPIWFHGVSVGEVHLFRQLIAAFRTRHPGRQVIVSTTPDTGFDEARRCFPDVSVIYFPFDFSWAVKRTLRTI